MHYSRAIGALPSLASGFVPPDPDLVKLNQNESPLQLPPEDRDALVDELRAVQLNRYPDPESRALTEGIARTAGVPPGMVLVGNGANELLELLIRSTCDPGDRVLTVAPTYHLYDRLAAMNRAELVKVPWGPALAFPRRELMATAGPRARMLLLCRPNNPTGHLFPAQEILALAADFGGMVVVDEAYYDFCRDTVADSLAVTGNVVVVRTLSKAYGAAGLRLGYLLAPAPIVRTVRALQLPYGVNAFTQAAGSLLISRPHIMERQRTAILEGRADLALRLRPVPGLTIFPSATNFLLARTTFSADALDRHLRAGRIFIRNLHWDDRHVRISVGTPSDHRRLVEGIRAFAGSAAAAPGTSPG